MFLQVLYYLNEAGECGYVEACYALGRLHEGLEVDDFNGLELGKQEKNPSVAGMSHLFVLYMLVGTMNQINSGLVESSSFF